MNEFNLPRLSRVRYKPSQFAEIFLGELKSYIAVPDRATMFRLALSRSLIEKAQSSELAYMKDMEWSSSPVDGATLFKDDIDVWACLICASVENILQDYKEFSQLTEMHIHRGTRLLQADYQDVGKDTNAFIIRIANHLPASLHPMGVQTTLPMPPREYTGALNLEFGEDSTSLPKEESIYFETNSPGTSPHMAILGKTRSGKTRTGLNIVEQICKLTNVPCLLIDPKGEFVKNGGLVSKSEWQGKNLENIIPQVTPTDVPLTPINLDFLYSPASAGSHEQARLAMEFKDSFQKCLRAKGDNALNLLREATLDLLQTQQRNISLDTVEQHYRNLCEERGQRAGSISAKLSEINSLNLFEPTTSPADFFSQNRVISFGNCSDEPRKLAIFLLLDALNSYLLSLPDSTVTNGYRSLRHLLVIDEAKDILSYRHGALSSLIRKSASKGGMTILLSQGPDDFDQEEDDFLQQMGTVGVFSLSASSVKSLTGAFGKRMKVEDFSDKSLPTGVALVKLPGEAPQKIKAW